MSDWAIVVGIPVDVEERRRQYDGEPPSVPARATIVPCAFCGRDLYIGPRSVALLELWPNSKVLCPEEARVAQEAYHLPVRDIRQDPLIPPNVKKDG